MNNLFLKIDNLKKYFFEFFWPLRTPWYGHFERLLAFKVAFQFFGLVHFSRSKWADDCI